METGAVQKSGISPRRNGQDDNLLRDTDVAAMIGVSRATLWRWVSIGQLPNPIKIGGVTRWWKSEIDAYLVSLTDARDAACA
jgi:predicted DNA-binding transcriptional regulator AlpA